MIIIISCDHNFKPCDMVSLILQSICLYEFKIILISSESADTIPLAAPRSTLSYTDVCRATHKLLCTATHKLLCIAIHKFSFLGFFKG